jgi:hypothetical protein
MPNWCSGDVSFYGSLDDLEKLEKQARQGTREVGDEWDSEKREHKTFRTESNNFLFDNFLPTPPDLLNGEGWHGWRVSNWGTKWDLDQDEVVVAPIQKNDDPTYYPYEFYWGVSFQTAWSPAFELFEKISEQYPNILIEYRYVEEGMAFFGEATIEAGEVDDDRREITTEDLIIAGCAVDSEGNIDWDNTDEYDLYLALDTWKEWTEYEQELEKEKEGEKVNG